MAEPKCFKCLDKDGVKACARCKLGRYCSVECQRAGWKQHKPFCNPELANLLTREKKTVRVVIDDPRVRMTTRELDIATYAKILSQSELAEIPNHVGEPIALYHVDAATGGPDNIMACFHMLSLSSGFAPAKWQSHPGAVWVLRTDGADHDIDAYADMHDFCYNTTDHYESMPPMQAIACITRASWLENLERNEEYRQEQAMEGDTDFE